MPKVLIGLGSNIEPDRHLTQAASSIREAFKCVSFSSVYQSKAIGMDGDDFLNACCLCEHDWSNEKFLQWLKSLEDEHGRDRSEGSWKPRTLDLDIIMVDGFVQDDDLYRYAHVFVPASELVDCSSSQDVQLTDVLVIDLVL